MSEFFNFSDAEKIVNESPVSVIDVSLTSLKSLDEMQFITEKAYIKACKDFDGQVKIFKLNLEAYQEIPEDVREKAEAYIASISSLKTDGEKEAAKIVEMDNSDAVKINQNLVSLNNGILQGKALHEFHAEYIQELRTLKRVL